MFVMILNSEKNENVFLYFLALEKKYTFKFIFNSKHPAKN